MGRLTSRAATAGTLLSALVSVSLVSLTLAGCSGDGDATTPKPSPTTSAAAPTTPPAPAPPPMPDAARAHTEAGAKAFVKHYADLIDYATRTLDTHPIEALSLPGCSGCKGGVAGIKEVDQRGAQIIGGHTAISGLTAKTSKSKGRIFATIHYDGQSEPEVIDLPGEKDDVRREGGAFRTTLILLAATDGWRVASLEVSQ